MLGPILIALLAACTVFGVADRIHVARLGRRAAVLDPRRVSMSDAVAVMTGALPPERLPAEWLA